MICNILIYSAHDVTPIAKPTQLVFRRFYFIARLEKTISLLRDIMQTARQKSIIRIADCSEMPHFSHMLVETARYRMQQSKSLKPIFVVWDDFSAYKSLEAELVIGKEDLFVKEFSQQLFFITKNILSTTHPDTYKSIHYNYTDIIHKSPESILDSLDYLIELIATQNNDCKAYKTTDPDIKMHATTDEINMRFYYIQRLSHAIAIIERDTHVIKSKRQVAYMKSAWSNIKQYRKLNDQDYIRDFCILVFNILRNKNSKPSSQDPEKESFLQTIDVEEILYGIYLITDELNTVMSAYNADKPESLKEWLMNNWKLPIKSFWSILYKLLYYHYSDKKAQDDIAIP